MNTNAANNARSFFNNRKSWTNWHQNIQQRIRGIYDLYNPNSPATPEGLQKTISMIQDLLGKALTRNIPVRALGGGWSFSRVPTTAGWVLNTKPLNWIFPISPASLLPNRRDDAKKLFLAQCGCNISEINRFLEINMAQSLRTTGASNGQTIAGAMSTGTHGSAIGIGAVQDHVVGMHLITGPDQHIWLEPASRRMVSKKFVDKLGADLVRDDALFNAAIVSFGSFGFVHAVMIETVKVFVLEAYRTRRAYNAGLKNAITTLDFTDVDLPDPTSRPYFFQMVLNPHTNSRPAYTTTMYKRRFPASHTIDYSISGGIGPGYDLLGPLGTLVDTIPALTPALVNELAKIQLRPFSTPKIGTLGETFDFSTPRSRGAGAAIGVPLARTVEALDVLKRVNQDIGPSPVIFACRFVQRSKGMLAFTRFSPTCVIDIDGVLARRTREFFEAAWQALNDADIPYTQHWGKINNLDADSVRQAYGDNIDKWLTARSILLPDRPDRRLFNNDFLSDLGLDA